VIVPAAKVGWYRPEDTRPLAARAPDPGLVAALRTLPGLSSSVSDVLDSMGLRLCIPAATVGPIGRGRASGAVVGRVLTIRYLPLRGTPGPDEPNGRLAYGTAFDLAAPGDVVVISAPRDLAVSVLGGNAMAAGRAAGLAAAIADGFVRDVDELEAVGVPVWAAGVTPVSGRGRLEAVAVNGPIEIRAVQVLAGDVAVADGSGIAFIPSDRFEAVASRLLAR
jgi:regulator of RNase E activity RraA